jgi:hypothetical protein
MIVADTEVGASNGQPGKEDARLSATELLLLRQGTPRALTAPGSKVYVPLAYRFHPFPLHYLHVIEQHIAGRVRQLIELGVPFDQLPHEITLWADEILFGDPVGVEPGPELSFAIKIARAKWRRLSLLRSDAWWNETIVRRGETLVTLVPIEPKPPARLQPEKGKTYAVAVIVEEMQHMRLAREVSSRWKAALMLEPFTKRKENTKPDSVARNLRRAHSQKYSGVWEHF